MNASSALQFLMPHLIVAPIVLPLLTAASLLLLGDGRRELKAAINLAATLMGAIIAAALLVWADTQPAPAAIGVYLPSNWPVPFGIVLALDRLTALMLVLTSVLGIASLLFSLARWHRAGVHFHPLFQVQLMGLNGAFLTADLFNLFVFFEIMLAASYGLLLHGSGRARVSAGLHYVAVNLLASSLFLIGVAVLYGVTGTLNMADMARKLSQVPVEDQGLLHAGAAILGVAFLAKAAMWPLNFWLVPAYSAASPPAAALFAIMTKVGIYAVLRLWTLFFPAQAGGGAPFGGEALVWGGLATLAFGALGMLASQHIGRVAGFAILISSGTLLASTGFGQAALTGGALFYMLGATLAISALFLLVELIERIRQIEVDPPRADDGREPLPFALDGPEPVEPPSDANLDEQEGVLVGRVIPAALAFLGLSFVTCALVIAGLPPLPGFLAKFTMLTALLNPLGLGAAAPPLPAAGWTLLVLLVVSGLLSMISLSRAGIGAFWAPGRPAPPLRVVETVPVAGLLLACLLLVGLAQPVLRYTEAAADALHRPDGYIDAVMAARPVPSPPRGEGVR